MRVKTISTVRTSPQSFVFFISMFTLLLSREQLHLMQAHGAAATGRVELQFVTVVVPAEIGRVAEPQRFAIVADELAREIQEKPLDAEVFHVGHHAPWAGDLV